MKSRRVPIGLNLLGCDYFYNLCIAGTDPYSNMAFVLAIVFVAIANILLLNVLIALFK
jgi:hypothetical protein